MTIRLRDRIPWVWARRGTAITFLGLLFLGRFDWFPWVKGTTAATTVCYVVPFADPLAAFEVMLATRSVQVDLAVGAAILLVVAALAGPVFCGWVCPLGLLLDVNDGVRRWVTGWVQQNPSSSPPTRLPRGLKYGILAFVLGFSAAAQLPVFQILSPINVVAWAVVFFAWHGLSVVGLIVALEWAVPRMWCRSLCPLGAVYSLMGRFARLRVYIRANESERMRCGQCTLYCPMAIPVMEGYVLSARPSVDHPDCTRCGACVDRCPTGVLRLGLSDADFDE